MVQNYRCDDICIRNQRRSTYEHFQYILRSLNVLNIFLSNANSRESPFLLVISYVQGPRLTINTISVMQRVLGSDRLLGTMPLALTASFNLYRLIKAHLHSNAF